MWGCVEQTDVGREQPWGVSAREVGSGARQDGREERRRWGERMGRTDSQKTRRAARAGSPIGLRKRLEALWMVP